MTLPVLRAGSPHQPQVLCSVQSQRLVDMTARVDKGPLWPLLGHGEDVMLVPQLLAAAPAGQDAALAEEGEDHPEPLDWRVQGEEQRANLILDTE